MQELSTTVCLEGARRVADNDAGHWSGSAIAPRSACLRTTTAVPRRPTATSICCSWTVVRPQRRSLSRCAQAGNETAELFGELTGPFLHQCDRCEAAYARQEHLGMHISHWPDAESADLYGATRSPSEESRRLEASLQRGALLCRLVARFEC